ncbi:MAG: phosphodiester glycosidase family protein, partial [Clostridia bacterium]|nr:phosphodiester glycosidase family protein [Clostridia bacterium]
MECFAVTADLNEDTVKIAANYKDNQISTYGIQTLSNQVAAAERNHEEPYTVAASVNATFFNMSTGVPTGIFVKDGEIMTTRSPNSYSYFAIMKDGTPRIGYASEIKNIKNDMLQAVAGSPLLIRNGKINSSDGKRISNYSETLNPRTCVGITPDNKVIFLIVDGRQAPKSTGLTPYQAALMFQSFGCTNALMLDGGGSSTFGSKVPGEDFSVKNTPSDGGERAIAGSMLIISEAVPTGELDHINLNCDFNHLTAGSSVQITPLGLDSTENTVPLPESGLVWGISDPSKGSVTEDGIFTVNEDAEGSVSVNISYRGNVLGTIDFSVVVPDTIEFSKKKMSVQYGSRFEIPLKASYGDYPVAVNANDIIAVHEYEYNGTVHDSLLDNYGYFDGLYFNAPEESIGIKSELLYMIPAFAEDESYISTMTLEFYKEGDDYFDFDNATYKSDKVSYYRTLSNTTTKDDYNYTVNNVDDHVYASYTFGIAMDEMEPPEEIVPIWDSFSTMLGETVWDAYLALAGKISSDTCVFIDFKLSPEFEFCGFDDLTITNNLFSFDKSEITVDEETNTARFIFRWNAAFVTELISSEEGLASDAVNSTIMVKDFNVRLRDPHAAQTVAGLDITNSFSISYDLIAWSASAYQIATNNADMRPYAYKVGTKKGVRFSTNYVNCEENYKIYASTADLNGWQGVNYYVNGNALTGIHLLPDKDGTQNEYYYQFDEFGDLTGKYTGLVKAGDSIIYSQEGTAVFAGLLKDD